MTDSLLQGFVLNKDEKLIKQKIHSTGTAGLTSLWSSVVILCSGAMQRPHQDNESKEKEHLPRAPHLPH